MTMILASFALRKTKETTRNTRVKKHLCVLRVLYGKNPGIKTLNPEP